MEGFQLLLIIWTEESCSSLEELADVRFQALVTPAGQEAIRCFFFNYCCKVAVKRGLGGKESLVSIIIKTRV